MIFERFKEVASLLDVTLFLFNNFKPNEFFIINFDYNYFQ